MGTSNLIKKTAEDFGEHVPWRNVPPPPDMNASPKHETMESASKYFYDFYNLPFLEPQRELDYVKLLVKQGWENDQIAEAQTNGWRACNFNNPRYIIERMQSEGISPDPIILGR